MYDLFVDSARKNGY